MPNRTNNIAGENKIIPVLERESPLVPKSDDLHAIIRDFKRFTSRTIHERLVADGRKTWLADAAEPARGRRDEFSLWRPGFEPRAVYSQKVLKQNLDFSAWKPGAQGAGQQTEGLVLQFRVVLRRR